MKKNEIKNRISGKKTWLLCVSAALVAATCIVLCAVLFSSPALAYSMTLGECENITDYNNGSLLVTGGEGLIELSNCDPSEYYNKSIRIRLTSNEINYHDLTMTVNGKTFQGLGSDASPFEGSFVFVAGSEAVIITHKALFNTLSTKATVTEDLIINPDTGENQYVLAEHVVSDTNDTEADWTVIYQTESGKNTYVNAGLIGLVDEDADVNAEIEFESAFSSKTLSIKNTGNAAVFVGTIAENATVTVSSNASLPATTIVSGQNAGLFAGAVNGSLAVDGIQSVFSGSYNISGQTNAGLLAGYLGQGAEVTADSSVSSSAVISSGDINGNAGGIIGYASYNSVVDLSGTWQIGGSVTASGNNGSAGGAIGYGDTFSFVTTNLTEIDISATVRGNISNGSTSGSGGFIGKSVQSSSKLWDLSKIQVTNANATGELTTYAGGFFGVLSSEGDGISITVTTSDSGKNITSKGNSGYYGGLIGYYKASSLASSLNITGLTVNSSFDAGTGNANYSSKTYGGIIAKLQNDKSYISIDTVEINANIANNAYDANSVKVFGGVVAVGANDTEGEYGLTDIKDIDVNVTAGISNTKLYISNDSTYGAVCGESGYSVIRLSGKTDLSDAWPFRDGSGKRGTALIVGNNTNALVYACGDGSTAATWQLIRPASTSVAYSDLGRYGEVIRLNSNMTENAGDSTDVFTYNGTAHTVTLHTLSYTVSSVRDFAVYSVASDCNKALPTGALILTPADASQDIGIASSVSLSGTGLTALSHVQTFTGTINGNNNSITFATGEKYGQGNSTVGGQIYFQEKVGLFSDFAGTAEDLSLQGTFDIFGVENAGSLAATVTDATVSFENITVGTDINDSYIISSYFNPTIYNYAWQNNVGGLMGKASGSVITVDGMTLSNSITVTNVSNASNAGAGGLLAYDLSDCDTSVQGIVVDGAQLDTGSLTFGGLVYNASGRFHVQKNTGDIGISYSGNASSFTGKTTDSETSSLTVCKGNGLYFILDKDALSISVQPSVSLNTGSYFDELVGNSIKGGNNGVVTIETDNKGHLDESSLTTYTHNLGSLYNNPNTRYYYDLYAICGNSGRTLQHAGKIGDAEEMMAFDAWTHAASGIRKYFVTNPGGTWTISGTIDLSGYSYYPVDVTFGVLIDNATITLDYQRYYSTETNNKMPDNNLRQHYYLHSSLFGSVSSSMTVQDTTICGTVGYIGGSGALVRNTISGTDKSQTNIKLDNIILDNLRIVTTENQINTYAPLLINKISSYVTLSTDKLKTQGYNVTSEVASSLIGDVGYNSSDETKGRKISLSFSGIKLDGRTYANPSQQWTVSGNTYEYNKDGSYVGTLFTKATLLNSFYYYDLSSCRGVYNFNSDEPVVTYGKEISYTASGRQQYWFYDTFNSSPIVWDITKSASNDNDDSLKTTYFVQGYLPYVYTVQSTEDKSIDLRVNQGSSASASGCGTYGHPYVITADNIEFFYDIGAFLDAPDINTIALNEVVVNKTVLNNSKFTSSDYHNTTEEANGNDIKLKLENGTWTVTEGSYTISDQTTLTNNVRRYLANAYYQFESTADKPIVIEIGKGTEFYGIGGASCQSDNAKLAFSGVLIGSDVINGTDITVKFTDGEGSSSTESKHYGLVTYANGCVVKNLNIKYEGTFTLDSDDAFTTTNADIDYVFFGGVFGYVIGGDNIIDSVYVDYSDATICVDGDYPFLANVGGYSGLVGGAIGGFTDQSGGFYINSTSNVGITAGGGIVFRNMASAAGLSSVSLNSTPVSTGLEYRTNGQNYLYWNPYVGRVLDGYACYDSMTAGSGTSTAATLNNTSKDYYIPTIYDTSTPSVELTSYTRGTSGGKVIVNNTNWEIHNEQGLWLLSAIVNSGAGIHNRSGETINKVFVPIASNIPEVTNPDHAYYYGKARSTSATYDYVGQPLTGSQISDECVNEIWWSGRYNADEVQISYLAYKVGGGTAIASISYDSGKASLLTKFCFTKDIDMSSYKSGFRGVGLSYSTDGVSERRANGNLYCFSRTIALSYFGSDEQTLTDADTIRTIKLSMERHEYTTEQYHMLGVGLLPVLVVPENSGANYNVNALKLTGSVSYSAWDYDSSAEAPTTDNNTAVGALFARYAYSHHNTINIGITYNRIFLNNLSITGGRYTGGLGGAASCFKYDFSGMISSRLMIMQNCGYDNIYIHSNGFAGGLFGVASFYGQEYGTGPLDDALYNNSRIVDCEFTNSTIESDLSCSYFNVFNQEMNVSIGGLIGALFQRGSLKVENCNLSYLTVQTTNSETTDFTHNGGSLGGICGTNGIAQYQYSLLVIGTTIENCYIGHANDDSASIKTLAFSAAGISGSSKTRGVYTDKLGSQNTVVKDCNIVWAVNLGGVQGFSTGNADSSVSNVEIIGNRIYADYDSLHAVGQEGNSSTSGIFGYISWGDNPYRHILLKDNVIIGINVGGVLGQSYTNVLNMSDISVIDSIIGITWDGDYVAWATGPHAGAISGFTQVNTYNMYNIYLENALIGEILNDSTGDVFTACHSLSEAFIDDMDENNIGLNDGGKTRTPTLRSYPWLAANGKLTSTNAATKAAVDYNAEYYHTACLTGKTSNVNGMLNVTGLYMHSDDNYWPFILAHVGHESLKSTNSKIVFADYSGNQAVTFSTDIAGVDINKQIELPGVTMYGNFIGNEFGNIFLESNATAARNNYWNCYQNVAGITFSDKQNTSYNLLDFLHAASPNGTGIYKEYYISTYHTQETSSNVPSMYDFPVLVINAKEDGTISSLINNLILLMTNTTSMYGTVEISTYVWSNDSNGFVADSTKDTLAYDDGTFSTNSLYNTSTSSFLLVRVKFADPSGGGSTLYLDIPVIVNKVMLFKVDLRILPGTTYVAVPYQNVVTPVIADHGDSFTTRIEYNYQRDLESWQSDIDQGVNLLWNYTKQIYLGNGYLPVGTRFVLVDTTRGGRAYYYTADEPIKQLDFTMFTSSEYGDWTESYMSEILGLLVTPVSGTGNYDVWNPLTDDDPTLKVLCIDGVYYKHNEAGTGSYNITLPSSRVNSSGYLVNPERYYLTIQTPDSTSTLINNFMGYGTSTSVTPLVPNAADGIASKPDPAGFKNTFRYLLTNSFSQETDVITTNGSEDMSEQDAIKANLYCIIPAITAAQMTDYNIFHDYSSKTIDMYQQFVLSLSEYDFDGAATACYITATRYTWNYSLYDIDGNAIDTAAKLMALSTANGYGVTSEEAQEIISSLSQTHEQNISGMVKDISITYSQFGKLMDNIGKNGFKLVANVKLIYDSDMNKTSQFPKKIVSENTNQTGIGVSAWSKIAYALDSLDNTGFAVGDSDTQHYFLPGEDEEISLVDLYLTVDDMQSLSVNTIGNTSFDITVKGFYDYSKLNPDVLDTAVNIRYTVSLLRKDPESNRKVPSYILISSPDSYLTSAGMTILHGTSVNAFTGTFAFTPNVEAIDKVTLSCSPITGAAFETLGYTYGNYRIQLKAELLDSAGHTIASTTATDYVVYTNAGISIDSLH